MTFSLVGIAPGSDATLSFSAHYEMLRTIKHFACGQLVVDSAPPAALVTSIKTKSVMSPSAPEELWTLTYGAHRVALSLVNPGAETGSTSGWSSVSQLSVVTDKPNVTGPNSGTYFFAPASLAPATASQTIDLVAGGILAADLDAGIVDVAVRWFQTGDTGNSDGVYFNIDYLDAGDVSISLDNNAGSAVSETTNNWTEKLQKGRCPVGTRKVIVTLHMPDGGDAYVDDITVYANENRFSVVGATSGAQAQLTPGVEYDNGLIRCTVDDLFTYLLNETYVLSATNGVRTLYQSDYAGAGNGKLILMELVAKQAEIWTLTCTSAAANGGVFSVVGSVSGAQSNVTVGTFYDNGIVRFLINDGTADFIVGDVFTLTAKAQELPLADRWQVEYFDDSIDNVELIMRGNGIPGFGSTWVAFSSRQSVASDYYNITVACMEQYVSSNSFATQPRIAHRTLPTWQFDVPYSLRITARSIFFSTNTEGFYDIAGAGFYLPYYLPGVYPYAAFVCASITGQSTTRYSNTSRSFGVGPDGIRVLWIDGSYKTTLNLPYDSAYFNLAAEFLSMAPTDTAEVTNYSGTGDGVLVNMFRYQGSPLETWTIVATSATNFTVTGSISGVQASATVDVEYDSGVIKFIIQGGATPFVSGDEFILVFSSQYSLEKIVLNDSSTNYGELEGVHFISGFQNAGDNVVVDESGDNHRVIRSINKAGFLDYATILED